MCCDFRTKSFIDGLQLFFYIIKLVETRHSVSFLNFYVCTAVEGAALALDSDHSSVTVAPGRRSSTASCTADWTNLVADRSTRWEIRFVRSALALVFGYADSVDPLEASGADTSGGASWGYNTSLLNRARFVAFGGT